MCFVLNKKKWLAKCRTLNPKLAGSNVEPQVASKVQVVYEALMKTGDDYTALWLFLKAFVVVR